MGNTDHVALSEFVQYLPQVAEIGLNRDELKAIPVHAEPPSNEDFLSLGELPPGAPPIGPSVFPFIGTRQIYVCRGDVPPHLWNHLAAKIGPHRRSGTGKSPMFGNPEERVVDEENPRHSWRRLDAGQSLFPGEAGPGALE